MSSERPVQPALSDLLAGYLSRQANAHAAGLATADSSAEVTPYDAGPVHPIDARLAWDETLAVAGQFESRLDPQAWRAPPQWPLLVAAHEPVVALACAVGNFPQLVRHFHNIVQTPPLSRLRPNGDRSNPAATPSLLDWARQASAFPQLLLAVGSLRLAKQFDEADKLVAVHDARVPVAWRTAWDNEKAALAWHAGAAEKARDLWQKLEPAVPVLFNRGMAELFLDRPQAARQPLSDAIARLPEDGAWHHLGRLYLTLCQSA